MTSFINRSSPDSETNESIVTTNTVRFMPVSQEENNTDFTPTSQEQNNFTPMNQDDSNLNFLSIDQNTLPTDDITLLNNGPELNNIQQSPMFDITRDEEIVIRDDNGYYDEIESIYVDATQFASDIKQIKDTDSQQRATDSTVTLLSTIINSRFFSFFINSKLFKYISQNRWRLTIFTTVFAIVVGIGVGFFVYFQIPITASPPPPPPAVIETRTISFSQIDTVSFKELANTFTGVTAIADHDVEYYTTDPSLTINCTFDEYCTFSTYTDTNTRVRRKLQSYTSCISSNEFTYFTLLCLNACHYIVEKFPLRPITYDCVGIQTLNSFTSSIYPYYNFNPGDLRDTIWNYIDDLYTNCNIPSSLGNASRRVQSCNSNNVLRGRIRYNVLSNTPVNIRDQFNLLI